MKKRASGNKILKSLLLLCVISICMGAGFIVWDIYKPKTAALVRVPHIIWPDSDRNEGKPFTTGFDGIDISAHQGRIRWDSLEKAKPWLHIIYVRARGRKVQDSLYGYNMKQAHSRGFKVGSYHFFNMNFPVEEQYRMFTRMTDHEHQDLRPVIDVEQLSLADEGNEHLKDSVMRFARLLEKHFGCRPVIYSNQNFYRKYLWPEFNRYPLWIANYSRVPVVKDTRPVLWQRGDTGHVHGIWTYVDIDQFINGGSLQDLLIPDYARRTIHINLTPDYFRPKSAGISPQAEVSHLMIGLE